MRKNEEKMYSYVYLEKELTPSYRKEINLRKHANEVADVFIETSFKLLQALDETVVAKDMERIIFTPSKEKKYELASPLRDKFEEKLKNSDLDAILSRFAQDAFKWYERIRKRDEDNEYINRTGRSEIGRGDVNGK